jgi:hypothetical protein
VVFACGAVLGQAQWFSQRASSHIYLAAGLTAVGVLICVGIFLAGFGRLFPAATASALSWLILGALGAGVASQPRPADYVLSLVEAGRLDLKTPLRWHSRLRDEPARLPWGYGYEIELNGVEYEGSLLPARGGLRVSFRRVRNTKQRRTFTRETKSSLRQKQNNHRCSGMTGRSIVEPTLSNRTSIWSRRCERRN